MRPRFFRKRWSGPCWQRASALSKTNGADISAPKINRIDPSLDRDRRRLREPQFALGKRAVQDVLDHRFFGVPRHRQLADQKVARPFEHFLFAEAERLGLRQEKEALEDDGYIEQGSGSHLVGIFLKPVFPIGGVFALTVAQELDDLLHLAVAHHASQTDRLDVVERHHDLQAAGFDLEQVEFFDLGADCPAADLFDDTYPMVRVDDLVSDTKGKVHEGRAAPQRLDQGLGLVPHQQWLEYTPVRPKASMDADFRGTGSRTQCRHRFRLARFAYNHEMPSDGFSAFEASA